MNGWNLIHVENDSFYYLSKLNVWAVRSAFKMLIFRQAL